MVTSTSSAAGENLTALRDLGVELSREGTLSLNETTFNTAVSDHYSEMVTMFTGDASFQSLVGDLNRGVAGDAVKALTDLMKRDASLMAQTDGAEANITRYKADLEKLDDRMELLLERYTKQFAVMDTLVGQFTRQREGLVSTFEGLANMYKK
jgi:flagellar hook-associated protein 2